LYGTVEDWVKPNIFSLSVSDGSKSKDAMLVSIENIVWTFVGRSMLNKGVDMMSCKVFIKAHKNYRDAPL
jgi:hypothetical protein